MNIETLLDIREQTKKKKPNFIRQQSELSKLKKTWRRPKGLHSKSRLNKKGHRKTPSHGYSSPRLVKYLNKDGLREILIHNLKDLEKVDLKTSIPKLAHVGSRNRLQILEKASSSNIKIANIKDVKKAIEGIKKVIEERKQKKKKVSEKKEAEKKKSEQKTPKKEEKKTKEQEKKEKDKLLTKKQ